MSIKKALHTEEAGEIWHFKGWLIVDCEDADEALAEALGNLHLITVMDHHEERCSET